MASLDQIRTRVSSQAYFSAWRRMAHDLRKLVAGDLSPVSSSHPEQRADDLATEELVKFTSAADYDYYDILTTDFTSGRTNKMLQAIKTLAFQTAYNIPDVTIEDGDPIESMAVQAYLRVRLGNKPRGCEWAPVMRLALFEYLINAIGWNAVQIDEYGQVVIRHIDSLDVSFDMTARLPSDIRWYSHRCRKPLWVWLEQYGPKPFKDLLEESVNMDKRVTLEYYYDIEGDGKHVVFRGDRIEEKPIFEGVNPFYIEDAGKRYPFLNAQPLTFLNLPSVRFPMSLAQMMLPHQMACWMSERYELDTLERGAPFYEVAKGALEPAAMKEFKDGKIGAIVERKSDAQPIVQHPAMEIPASIMAFNQQNDSDLTGMAGVNPYASGERVEGVSYAAEVNAIQGNSDLTASTIAKDVANFAQRMVKMYLATAALYDDNPVTIRVGETDMTFGGEMPISMFIRPDMDLMVAEDSMKFMSELDRVSLARAGVDDALKVAQMAPQAPLKAYEKLLRVSGEKDIAKWLEPPAQMMVPDATQIAQEAQASMG